MYVPNPRLLKQGVPERNRNGIRIHCNNLVILFLFVTFVIRVKAIGGVAEREMAEDAGQLLALARRPTPPPNPIVECAPPV